MTGTDTFLPSETLLWDYITTQVRHPAVARLAKSQKPVAQATANAFASKQTVVLSNMSATCLEQEEDTDTGQPACMLSNYYVLICFRRVLASVAVFKANKRTWAPSTVRPGNVVRCYCKAFHNQTHKGACSSSGM